MVTSVVANPNPQGDASYLAYLNAMGVNETNVNNAYTQNREQVYTGSRLRSNDIIARDKEAQRGIVGSFASRGLYRSGDFGHAMAQQLAQTARAQESLKLGRDRALAAITQQRNQALGGLHMQRADAEAGLVARIEGRAQADRAAKAAAAARPVVTTNYVVVPGATSP